MVLSPQEQKLKEMMFGTSNREEPPLTEEEMLLSEKIASGNFFSSKGLEHGAHYIKEVNEGISTILHHAKEAYFFTKIKLFTLNCHIQDAEQNVQSAKIGKELIAGANKYSDLLQELTNELNENFDSFVKSAKEYIKLLDDPSESMEKDALLRAHFINCLKSLRGLDLLRIDIFRNIDVSFSRYEHAFKKHKIYTMHLQK